MNKIVRYNQVLLATFGTLAVIGLVALLTAGLVDWIGDLTRERVARPENQLVVENPLDTGEVKVMTQGLTYSMPQLIDTPSLTHIITVSQVELKKPELLGEYGEPNVPISAGIRFNKGKYRIHNGHFNNLIIYNGLNQLQYPLFTEKINVSSYQYYEMNGQRFILISGSKKDSNKDNFLNDSDLESFYVFDLDKQKMYSTGYANHGLLGYKTLYNTDEIVLKFGEDKDGNGEYDSWTEPNHLFVHQLNTQTAEPFVDEQTAQKLRFTIN